MVPLDATPEQIANGSDTQARILAAEPDEVDAARRITEALLGHPLFLEAQEAWGAGKCRRETTVAWGEPDGLLVEGVLDLASKMKTVGRSWISRSTESWVRRRINPVARSPSMRRLSQGNGQEDEVCACGT